MPLELSITLHGNLALRDASPVEESSDSRPARHVVAAFAESSTRGLLCLAAQRAFPNSRQRIDRQGVDVRFRRATTKT